MRTRFAIIPLSLLLTAFLWADEPQLKTVDKSSTACHGTSIDFVDTPVLAAKIAAREKKLVLVLHVSGYFETPDFT
jgi:hypothetical protein